MKERINKTGHCRTNWHELSKEDFWNIFNQAGLGFAQADHSGQFLLVNKMYSNMVGRSSEELYDMSLQDITHPDDFESFNKIIEKILVDGKKRSIENRGFRPDGSIVWLNNDIFLFTDKGKSRCVTLITQDITTRKEAEVSQAYFLELSRMDLEKLKTEREIREKFVATLTHDLRNPLIIAKASAELLIRNKGKAKKFEYQKRLTDMIVAGIDRADRMIQDLLDANRIRAGQKLPIHVNPCEIKSVIKETIDTLTQIYGDRLVLHAEQEISGHWCSEGLRRVVENLVSNGIKYGLANTPVSTTLEQFDQKVRIAVHNQGKELTAQEQVAIFKPFQRSQSADQGLKKGWGLGLTLVVGIIESHGGTFRVQSVKDKGTTFIIELPMDSRPYQKMNENEE
jgi:PAS domain S-box-containing protein